MISMINYPSDSPKEFYGGSNPEGRFYFPNRYRKSKKEPALVEQQEPENEEMIKETLRKLSATMWTETIHRQIAIKLQEDPSPTPTQINP
ncbi:unnamed protein product, partial [Mesorhabditis belari]|uniref:Uncharacterized protein n=1 Tax=Mesorhabditis belari TaxID=2138241 RepID=A0AAF3F127_9BILA